MKFINKLCMQWKNAFFKNNIYTQSYWKKTILTGKLYVHI